MGYSKSVYRTAKERLFERRLSAQRNADQRRFMIYRQLPRAQQLEKMISESGIQAARAVVRGENVVLEMEKLRDKNLAMQKELKELLENNGYSENIFEPEYFCKTCNDTGYVEKNGRTLMCSCLKNMLVSCACEELNRTTPLALSTFESFNLEYYDKAEDKAFGMSPYVMMTKIFNYCKKYADEFTPNSKSILMTGATGLGKTHLSLAIANEVIKKGYGVIYASAPTLMAKLEKIYFSNIEDDSTLDMLLECDLLIIDDLGTEFHAQFSVSQLYNIFNSRMLSNKPIIINTNLSMRELEKFYTERFVSRLSGNAQKLSFMGKDIRIRKKC